MKLWFGLLGGNKKPPLTDDEITFITKVTHLVLELYEKKFIVLDDTISKTDDGNMQVTIRYKK